MRWGWCAITLFRLRVFTRIYAVFAPNSRSLQEQQEEKVFGLIPKEKQKELYRLIRYERPLGKKLSGFFEREPSSFCCHRPQCVESSSHRQKHDFSDGRLTAEGKRILKFDHDTGRRHSPIIDRIGEVYIVENKSVAAYLRQLAGYG